MLRQLGPSLHMESSFEVVQSLHPFLNKFHFILNPQIDQITKMKAEELSKQANKVMIFLDVNNYAEKIKAALSRWLHMKSLGS